MVPPPITPSPHRFITKPPSHLQSTKPTSSLRTQQKISQSPQQFAPTPKFTPRRFVEDVQPPAPSRLARPTLQRSKIGEEIDDPSSPQSPSLPGKEEDRVSHSIKHSVEDDGERKDPAHDSSATEGPRPRKRRWESTYSSKRDTIDISSSPSPTSSLSATSVHSLEDNKEEDDDLLSHPTWLSSNHQTSHSRFRLSHQHSLQETASQPLTRPSFLLPAPSVAHPETTPLPEAFSPHRRGGMKYIPGGLASTVREWILELPTKSAGSTGGTIEGAVEVGVSAMRAGQGMTMVQGTGPEAARWLLLGQGKGEGKIRVGGRVGIKKPVWNVHLGDGDGEEEGEGDKWNVSIEWSVLYTGREANACGSPDHTMENHEQEEEQRVRA